LENTTDQHSPVKIEFFKDKKIKMVSVSYAHVLVANETLYSFGRNEYGQLGIGNRIDQLSPVEVEFFKDKKIYMISAGHQHTLIVTNESLYSFGHNIYGQLGIGNTINQLSPVEIEFFKDKNITYIPSYKNMDINEILIHFHHINQLKTINDCFFIFK